MTLEASIRRTILPTQDRGSIISDSQKNKDPVPQLNITPGIVRPVFKFEDGNGLTDAFGNLYDGYSTNSGGYSINTVHSPARSVDEELDSTSSDGDIQQYDDATEKYVAKSLADVGLAPLDAGTADNQFLLWDNSAEKYVPTDEFEDSITFTIEVPTDRVYTLVTSLTFDITVTTSSFNFESGPGSVSFPGAGVITAGNPVTITVSATDGSSEFLTGQLNFTRKML